MKVCRTCLQVLNDDAPFLFVGANDGSTETPSIRRKLLDFVPEIALDVQQAIICVSCSNALNAAYDFKNKCLQTEEKVSNYAQHVGCSRDSVDMLEVVSFNDGSDDCDSEFTKQEFTDVHYPTPQTIEQDYNVNVKPLINSCNVKFPDSITYDVKNIETNFKIKSETPDYEDINNGVDYLLPESVIFSSELDVEVRAFKSEQTEDSTENDNYDQELNHFMQVSEIKHVYPVCNLLLANNSQLDSHVSSHMEMRPLQCTLCERRFIRKDKLKLHMRTHTGEKPFDCTVCGRCFSRKDKLNNHMRIHTGEKPYICILCPKRFSRGDKMNAHMKSQHKQALSNLEITVVNNKKEGLANNVNNSNIPEISSSDRYESAERFL